MSRQGPPKYEGDLAATALLRSIEILLWDLCVENGFCGSQARLPRDEAQSILSQRLALHGKVAELVVSLRVTPRWMLEHIPLRSEAFAQAILASESRGAIGSIEQFRDTVQQSFEANFGPLLCPAAKEVSAALLVLDRREAHFGWVV
ncbi:MAG: hypothetical protein AAF371_00040 [Pseudomonadota bacterium]